jgi:MerR family transcriptional regulator/heat shock protein HspR
MMATYRRRVKATFNEQQGVFMISVAAELAEMHPQTLRMYEQRGLIAPKRSPKNTRLYSQRDVERLRRIQQMTAEGLNLAGVETVLALEARVQKLHAESERLRKRLDELETKRGKDGGG